MSAGKENPPFLYTIGHSTKPLDAFIELLKIYKIELLTDIRTVPRSRRNPQFNKDSFPAELKQKGIRLMQDNYSTHSGGCFYEAFIMGGSFASPGHPGCSLYCVRKVISSLIFNSVC